MSFVYVILVAMFMFNPADRNGSDVIELISLDGNPLQFETEDTCMKHIEENHLDIAHFAIKNFMPQPTMVKGIFCMKKRLGVGV